MQRGHGTTYERFLVLSSPLPSKHSMLIPIHVKSLLLILLVCAVQIVASHRMHDACVCVLTCCPFTLKITIHSVANSSRKRIPVWSSLAREQHK